MAVRIRLMRMGKKKKPSYRVVVTDGRKPRDGRYIEQIGRYDPLAEPSVVEISNDRAVEWLARGAQPSDRVRKLMEISGAWTRYRVAAGKAHRVTDEVSQADPGAAGEGTSQEDASQAAAGVSAS
ncbi:MAG: 30S ribosomal protein S16 [Acidimicrobiia bacterium]|nr:30S ribosomal protein S16 [Acidimicrobiia bacterium]